MYRVYGAWRLGGVWGGTGGFGTFSNMLEKIAKTPESLHSAWDSYGVYLNLDCTFDIRINAWQIVDFGLVEPYRTNNIYVWAGPANDSIRMPGMPNQPYSSHDIPILK